MGTPLGPKYIPYTYMDPLGLNPNREAQNHQASMYTSLKPQALKPKHRIPMLQTLEECPKQKSVNPDPKPPKPELHFKARNDAEARSSAVPCTQAVREVF